MNFQLNDILDVFQVKSSKTKILRTEMTDKKMQGRNRNKLVFSKFPLVPFIGSLSRFQPTTTYIIHPQVHSIPFQEEEEKGEDEEEKP